MSYLNGQEGYREQLLSTRSVVKKDNFVLLEVDGLVENRIPGYENCDVSILASPEMGASFADYFVSAHAGGKNTGIGGNGIETFLYVVQGEVDVQNADEKATLTEDGYFFSPDDKPVTFENKSGKEAKIYVHRKRHEKLEGYRTHTVVGNSNDLPWLPYEGMDNCMIKDLLPSAEDWAFDINMHMLKFSLGASHGYIETHFQEHGMYFLTGKGMYKLDDEWIPVQKGDYVFIDNYCPQACYAVGRGEDLSYVYSKDCNRDVKL